jgi:hypothetical protein
MDTHLARDTARHRTLLVRAVAWTANAAMLGILGVMLAFSGTLLGGVVGIGLVGVGLFSAMTAQPLWDAADAVKERIEDREAVALARDIPAPAMPSVAASEPAAAPQKRWTDAVEEQRATAPAVRRQA